MGTATRDEGSRSFLASIEKLYTAALDPSQWPHFLAEVSRLLRADNAYLSEIRHDGPRLSYEVVDRSAWESTALSRYVTLIDEDPRMPAFRSIRFKPLHCRQVTSERRLHESRIYQEALRHLGIEFTLVVNLDEESGATRYLGLTRTERGEAFDEADCATLDEMIPHLERALAVRNRMKQFDRERAVASEIFSQLPIGVAVVTQSGRVVSANTAARKVAARAGIRLDDGRVRADEQVKYGMLMDAVHRMVAGQTGTSAGALAVPLETEHEDHRDWLLVSRIATDPALRSGSDGEGGLALLLTGPAPESGPTPCVGRVFGLTPAQTRLARLLATGFSLREAARRMGITEGSARQYLKIIFRKTGAHRQADLVRMMTQLPGIQETD